MFTENKYTKIYFQIIHKRKVKSVIDKSEIDIYSETHHIIPRSLGGENDDNNLVRLTAREHYICHYLLTKMMNSKPNLMKMIHAFNMMNSIPSRLKNCRVTNSRLHEYNRIKLSIIRTGIKMPVEFGRKISESKKGFKHSQETKQKLREINLGKIPNLSEEGRQAIILNNKTRFRTPEENEKISKALKGKEKTQEHKDNLKKALVNKPPVSKETAEKISKIKTGVPLSDFHKERISEGLVGHIVTDETKKKISIAKNKNPYRHSEEIKKEIASKMTGLKRNDDFKKNHSQINIGKKKMEKGSHRTWVKKEDIELHILNFYTFTKTGSKKLQQEYNKMYIDTFAKYGLKYEI